MKQATTILLALICACSSSSKKSESEPLELRSARGVKIDLRAEQPATSYDPLALARASVGTKPFNEEASTPVQCYTRADGLANTCASCHTHSLPPNFADDWELQQNYSFTDYAMTNRWKNQFRERGPLVDKLAEADILGYVRRDNYKPLQQWFAAHRDAPGWHPDLDFTRGFDADGFSADGTGWRAVRYKPFLGAFWTTNGSAGDVFIRLPKPFRSTAAGEPSLPIYRANLAILEAAITADPEAKLPDLARDVEPIDERAAGIDLDGDGNLGTATKIVGLPAKFAGAATGVAVTRGLYPQGTEFLHSIRYLDPDRPGSSAMRMKELRYAQKMGFLEERAIAHAYLAAEAGSEPLFTGDSLVGLKNGFSWQLQAYIEDAHGWLRKQTDEEHQFCMGCHSNVGVNIDQTFSFARKVPGLAGWRPQDPAGIADAPQLGHTAGEYAEYLHRVGGRGEGRLNDEVAARFREDGTLDPQQVAAMRADIASLLMPSRERSIALDRAYLANVIEQSYIWGREANTSPASNVHDVIKTRSTGLGEADRVVRDNRLQLDWNAKPPPTPPPPI